MSRADVVLSNAAELQIIEPANNQPSVACVGEIEPKAEEQIILKG